MIEWCKVCTINLFSYGWTSLVGCVGSIKNVFSIMHLFCDTTECQ